MHKRVAHPRTPCSRHSRIGGSPKLRRIVLAPAPSLVDCILWTQYFSPDPPWNKKMINLMVDVTIELEPLGHNKEVRLSLQSGQGGAGTKVMPDSVSTTGVYYNKMVSTTGRGPGREANSLWQPLKAEWRELDLSSRLLVSVRLPSLHARRRHAWRDGNLLCCVRGRSWACARSSCTSIVCYGMDSICASRARSSLFVPSSSFS